MKILVSGGTGFIGRAIVQTLLKKNHRVRILTRDHKKASTIFCNQPIEIAEGDVTEPATLLPALEGIETVIQCAQFPGHPVENRRKGFTYFQVDALGTEKLANAAKLTGVKHFLYISGAGTHGKATEPWFAAKWHAEEAIRAAGLRSTILRPSSVYGPGDRSLNRILNFAKFSPAVPLIGDGQNYVQPILIDDLGKIVAHCVENPPLGQEESQLFEVGGPKEMTMKEFIQTALQKRGMNRILLPIPKFLVKFAAFFLQFLPNPPLTPKAVDFITMDVHVTPKSFKIN